MWSQQYGFVITEAEIFKNADQLKRKGYAPNLRCENCKGTGFVHPFVSGQIEWWTAMPCPICLTEQYQKFWNTRYSGRYES